MKKEENQIGEFDETKVSVDENEYRTIYYDITETIKNLVEDNIPSVLEYVVKIETEIESLYDEYEEDFLSFVKENYDDFVQAEYRNMGCYKYPDGIRIRNDARQIRLTFINGSVMEISNSEWGSILLCNAKKKS